MEPLILLEPVNHMVTCLVYDGQRNNRFHCLTAIRPLCRENRSKILYFCQSLFVNVNSQTDCECALKASGVLLLTWNCNLVYSLES